MPSGIDSDSLNGPAAFPFPPVLREWEPADDSAVTGGVLSVECHAPQGESLNQSRNEPPASVIPYFLHKDHIGPAFDDVVHKGVKSSRDARTFLPDVDLKYSDSVLSLGN